MHKKYGDSFEDTTLESELARRGVGRLVVTGAQTDACIRSTLHGAFTRDTTRFWSVAPGGRLPTAGVIDTAGVNFDATEGSS